jgi:hypothetical protein
LFRRASGWRGWQPARKTCRRRGTHLVFRTFGLRGQPASHMGGVRVCPAEDGLPRQEPVTCDRCGICWHPLHAPEEDQPILPPSASRRMSLPLLLPGDDLPTPDLD